jgi:large subunit ribosomal protein L25
MAKQVSLKATVRSGIGRTQAKKVRSGSRIPAIVYGSHIQPTPIQLDQKEIENVFKHSSSDNMLVDLTLDDNGKSSNRLAFLQEIQRHPVTDQVLHLDFHEIRADEKLHARVMVVAVGEAEGVRTSGGILAQVLRELEIECLPKNLPERIQVDVTSLQIGQNIHVSDIKPPEGVTILNRKELSVFSVTAPMKEESAAPVAAAGAAEPELVKKKGEEGEEAAGDAKGAAGKTDAKAGAKPDAKAEGKPAAKAEKK